MKHVDISPISRLQLDGAGSLMIHGAQWRLYKADESAWSDEEQSYVSIADGLLTIDNRFQGGIPAGSHIGNIGSGMSGTIIQHGNNRIGNISNSVVGTIVQDGQRIGMISRPAYRFVLECPVCPTDIRLDGATELHVRGQGFAQADEMRYDVQGSSKAVHDDGRFAAVDATISGSSRLALRSASAAAEATSVILDVDGASYADLSGCPCINARISLSGASRARLDTDRIRGTMSGCGELHLLRQTDTRDLRVSGAASVRR